MIDAHENPVMFNLAAIDSDDETESRLWFTSGS